jgi:hypothetical protein
LSRNINQMRRGHDEKRSKELFEEVSAVRHK